MRNKYGILKCYYGKIIDMANRLFYLWINWEELHIKNGHKVQESLVCPIIIQIYVSNKMKILYTLSLFASDNS